MRTSWVWLSRTAVCALALSTLAACGSMRTTYLANGVRGYSISCRGFLNTWNSCLVQAGRTCGPLGYDTITEDQYDRTLLIGCKRPTTLPPSAAR